MQYVNSDIPYVEAATLEWYTSRQGGGWSGVHTENGFWLTLYGILFADLLLEGKKICFPTPLMEAPLDFEYLSSSAFGLQRTHERLRAIASGPDCTPEGKETEGDQDVDADGSETKMSKILDRNWKRYYGQLVIGVNWRRNKLKEIQSIAECFGGKVIGRVCELLTKDYRLWRHGFPDLLMWKGAEKKGLLVEVKGPGDSQATPKFPGSMSSSKPELLWMFVMSSVHPRSEGVPWTEALGVVEAYQGMPVLLG
eukprot:CAMPEP_0184328942 /NCGR_PEP_ID=MMETSP1049-20130417/143888_1 /TAXON_ID=77928 /ORGANISM="Proteomonas sulcata, Strain CCMP704" /LENGTH=252 /DNA_ID=CAMNT_0026651281 /DNA_START=187 /DNA_END=946 /DNA_ORIENTATION=+